MNFPTAMFVSPREELAMNTDLDLLATMLDPLLSTLECSREAEALAWRKTDGRSEKAKDATGQSQRQTRIRHRKGGRTLGRPGRARA